MTKFEKIPFEEWEKSVKKLIEGDSFKQMPALSEEDIRKTYDELKLPERSTASSAGYDFFAPFDIDIPFGTYLTIPTGIRCKMPDDKYLAMYPRSGHGFKFGIRLANTVGIIDSDYYNADNYGHIMIRIVNESIVADKKSFIVPAGKAFVQGIITPYGVTDDDTASASRTGGFGSTG